MRDPDIHLLQGEALVLRMGFPGSGIIDIAVHGPKRFPLGEFIRHMQAADIPSMPDLVARGKVLTYARIEPAVGVR